MPGIALARVADSFLAARALQAWVVCRRNLPVYQYCTGLRLTAGALPGTPLPRGRGRGGGGGRGVPHPSPRGRSERVEKDLLEAPGIRGWRDAHGLAGRVFESA